MEAKGFPVELVKEIIDEMQSEGWQSDERFAESFIRNRIHSGFGPVRIDYELRQRGIEKAEQDHVVVELAGSWKEIIEQVYFRKYTGSRKMTRNEWAKRTRFLQQRGFTIEMIRSFFVHVNITLN